MKLTKWMVPLSVLMVIAMLMTACSSAATPAAVVTEAPAAEVAETQAAPAATEAAAASEPITIQFWDGLGAPDNAEMQALVKQFNEENTYGITVVDTELDWDTLYSKLLLDYSAGNPPDIVTLQQTDILEEQGLGILQSIDDLYPQYGINGDDFMETAWTGGQIDGVQYAIPFDVHPLVLYYNVDLFEAAGLDPEVPPTTMEEFLDYAQKLTDPSKEQYGVGAPYTGGLPFRTWMSLIWQHTDGMVLSEDGSTAAFNSDAGVESLQFLYDLVYKYKVSPQGEQDVDTDFKQGKIAMVIEGPWELADFDTVEGLNYKTAMLPVFYDQPAAWANSHTVAFPNTNDPQKTDAAMKFAAFLIEHNYDWTANTGHQPVVKSVFESDEFKSLEKWQPIADTVAVAHFYPAIPQEWEVFARQPTSPFVIMMESVMLDKSSVADAVATAESTVNDILSQ